MNKNILHTVPLPLLLPHLLPLGPILRRHPDHMRPPDPLPRVRLRLGGEPPRLMFRQLTFLAQLSGLSLLVFLFRLELVRVFVATKLEGALIWP